MSWRRLREKDRRPPPVAAEVPSADLGPRELILHACCICGALFGEDPEDEIDGEGPGRDICGPCNRTRNFDVEMGW